MIYFPVSVHFWLCGISWRKVKLTLGEITLFLTGRLWYQYTLVGKFIISKLPCSSSSFTGWIWHLEFLLRESLCRNTKSLQAPKDTEAIGLCGTSSFSSSLWSPMWSFPSLYLPKTKWKAIITFPNEISEFSVYLNLFCSKVQQA